MQSLEESRRCIDRRSSHCCSSVLSQHDGRGRTCPQAQHQTLENPHLNTTQQSWLPKSCPDKSISVPGEEDVCPRITAPKPQIGGCHKVGSSRLENWISPESTTKGIKSFELPRTTNPTPSCVGSHPSRSCLPCSCSLQLLSKPSSQHTGTRPTAPQTLLGLWGLHESLPLMAEQDPASRPCYFLLGASSSALGLAAQRAARSPLPPHTLLLLSQDQAQGVWVMDPRVPGNLATTPHTTLTTTSASGKRGDRDTSSTHGWLQTAPQAGWGN